LTECRNGSFSFILVAAATPREGLLECTMITEEAHLQIHLEEAEVRALVNLAYAMTDHAHQNLLRIFVLVALGGRELQFA
jgi:hypothetical protein